MLSTFPLILNQTSEIGGRSFFSKGKCKTHFACKQCGYLHAYGTKCDRVDSEYTPNPESEKIFQEIIDGWRKSQE